MTQSQLIKMIGNFSIGKVIGSGTFGKVREGIHLPTKQKVAIKILEKNKIKNKKDIQRIKTQLQILTQIDHPNILKLLEVKQTDSQIFIITQLVKGQQLYSKIVEKGILSLQSANKYFVQLYKAVKFLHQKNIVHRDIKPQNIIVDGQSLKLIDFGLSNKFTDNSFLMQTPCGSPCYAAPQMVLGKMYDCRKVDIWAMGVTLYAMLAGRLPFQHQNTQKLYKLIQSSTFEQIKGLPSYLNILLKAMIENKPQKRIQINEIGQNLWIKNQIKECKKQVAFEWNEQILKKMQKIFKFNSNQLKSQIKRYKSSEIATYYYLASKSKSNFFKSKKQQQLYHQGPFHMQFVFKNKDLLQLFLTKNEINFEWIGDDQKQLNRYQIKINNKIHKIKRLKNLSNSIYFPLDRQFLKIEQTNNSNSNQQTTKYQNSQDSFFQKQSSIRNICLQTF